MQRVRSYKTILYFIVLLSTIFLLFMVYYKDNSIFDNPYFNLLIVISILIEFIFTTYILVSTAE